MCFKTLFKCCFKTYEIKQNQTQKTDKIGLYNDTKSDKRQFKK